ncbi:MAG: tyrosine-protein phosphatase [Candidatus Heimdallarchaeaceae archaeon]
MDNNELLSKVQSKVGNFRDLAIFNQSYIRQNVIYRSSSPIPHQSPELLQEFKDLGIKSIIDLRSAIEIGHSSYEDEFLNNFNYYWVHVDISMPHDVLLREGISELSFYKQFCWYTLFYNKTQIRKVFNILSRPENLGTVMHCHAGRDRTGIMSSLILLLLNAPEPNIIQDYLATDEFTQGEDIEFIVDEVDKLGGIMEYLVSCDLLKETLEGMVEQLCPL